MPRIAVLLPTYNPGPELAETLDSLRRQTVPFRTFSLSMMAASARVTMKR